MKPADDIPERELGPELDRMIELQVEATSAVHELRDVNVRLDTVADSRDLPPDAVADLRGMQRSAQDLLPKFEALAEGADQRASRIRERLDGD